VSPSGPPRQLERDHHVHQALLRAVMEVALDAPACLVAGGRHASARRHELRPGFGIGNHHADELGDVRHAFLGVRRQGLARRRRDHCSPDMTFHDDRARHHGLAFDATQIGRNGARCPAVVALVHASRPARAKYLGDGQ